MDKVSNKDLWERTNRVQIELEDVDGLATP